MSERREDEPRSLNLNEGSAAPLGRVGLVAVLLGVVVGAVVGFFAGRLVGTVTAVVVAAMLVALSWAGSRRQVDLVGNELVAQAMFRTTVDLSRAERLDLMVTELRGVRSISLIAGGPPKNRTVTVSLAVYSGIAGRELDIVALRALADALASSANPTGLLLSELLVAQLRVEARGGGAGERPLYRLVHTVDGVRITRKVPPDALTKFVATLD